MSKINNNKINFDDDDFLVDFDLNKKNSKKEEPKKETLTQEELEHNRSLEQRQEILFGAQKEAQEIIEQAQKEAQEILKNAKETSSKEKEEIEELALSTKQDLEEEKEKILEEAKKEAQDLLTNSKEELENIRIKATNDGYQDGYQDGLGKIQEELEEKIQNFDKFLLIQEEAKEKLLKSADKDILDIIIAISKKILLKEIDGAILENIIKKTISMLEKKEEVNIILSENYARLLLELQNKSLNEDEKELKFEDFKQYQGFNIIYNKSFAPDTIIVENPKERFDASINTQLDNLIRDILENNSKDI